MASYKEIKSLDDLKTEFTNAGDKPVFVKFGAEWCGNCEMIADKLDEFAVATGDKAVFLKVDVEEAEDVAEEYEDSSLPRMLHFKSTKKCGEMFGNKPEKYEEFIKTNCP